MAEPKPAAREEPSIEELAYLERLYGNQHALLSGAIEEALGELQEIGSASKSIENLSIISGRDSLEAIGGEIYIKARVDKSDTVLVGVGGGYLVEKESTIAISFLKSKSAQKNQLLDKMIANRKEIEKAITDLSERITKMTKGY